MTGLFGKVSEAEEMLIKMKEDRDAVNMEISTDKSAAEFREAEKERIGAQTRKIANQRATSLCV